MTSGPVGFSARSINLVPDEGSFRNQPSLPDSWVHVSSPMPSGAPASPVATLYSLSPGNTVVSQPGIGAPVNGWGLIGSGRNASGFAAPSQLYQAERFINSTSMPGVFVAEGAPVDGPLGFCFEKVENGPARGFNFVMAITAVDEGSWAEMAGIEVGCTILRLNNEDVAPMTMQELSMKLERTRPLILVLQSPSDPAQDHQPGVVDWASVQKTTKPTTDTNQDYYEAVVDVASKKLYDGMDVSKGLLEVPPGILRMFPTVFLLFCLAVFVMPVYLVLYVGEDINTQQWFPRITNYVWILPGLYIVTCFAHVCRRRPSKFFVTLSLLGSCILLLVVSDVILIEAYDKGPMFAAVSDCMSWGDKRMVEEQWNQASTFYTTCMNQMATQKNITVTAAMASSRIQDCANYTTVSALHPTWGYLEKLEQQQQCGGWCKAAAPLWTIGPMQDACAPVVAQVIHDKIVWCLRQVCFYTIFTLLVVSVLLITIPPVFKKYGVEW